VVPWLLPVPNPMLTPLWALSAAAMGLSLPQQHGLAGGHPTHTWDTIAMPVARGRMMVFPREGK